MEAPKCKLCGQRHYGLCRAQEPQVVTRIKSPPGGTVTNATVDELHHRAFGDAGKAFQQAFREGIQKGAFDRVAYQREYMRKWRAKRKTAPE